jgi:hypothetical protein
MVKEADPSACMDVANRALTDIGTDRDPLVMAGPASERRTGEIG